MGLFRKKISSPEELTQLKADIAAMAARLEHADAEKRELGARVQGIVTRLDTPISTPPPGPPKPAEPPAETIRQADIDMLNARMQRLELRLDQVDARITQIATELANQLNELSDEVSEIASTANQPVVLGDDGRSDEALSQASAAAALASAAEAIAVEIRDAQVKLANEQARYQIAFRGELAELAERLKRS